MWDVIRAYVAAHGTPDAHGMFAVLEGHPLLSAGLAVIGLTAYCSAVGWFAAWIFAKLTER
jgi:hypothetical protein